jgi:hypothetical protein
LWFKCVDVHGFPLCVQFAHFVQGLVKVVLIELCVFAIRVSVSNWSISVKLVALDIPSEIVVPILDPRFRFDHSDSKSK